MPQVCVAVISALAAQLGRLKGSALRYMYQCDGCLRLFKLHISTLHT
jgi:rRNA maturation endonuclease Nob1